ncbi:DNA topoisomerase IV [Flavobacterium akiainvivens]|uniref:DNA topoisomerase IV n=1 Tax=Flavobacterium akiainvivens TaxID=1202724 RepID=A0A0M9VH35_9FLAO|nr:hypothetical protein [Flavobacterium akiainvivens]KOS05096.1 DNA topoisomerase IV [Flavobacterium akiainvivens]SFQ51675.1 hypothetical protein SAMN05444144_106228 [Flavobacterium akiainvivens]
MKRLIYLLPLFVIVTSCYEAERNCADFKTGKFKYELTLNGKTQTTIVERNDSIQVETFEGKTDTASVRWVNDCEFVMQNLHPKSREEKKGISIRILTTKGNTATVEFSLVGEAEKQKVTVTKID